MGWDKRWLAGLGMAGCLLLGAGLEKMRRALSEPDAADAEASEEEEPRTAAARPPAARAPAAADALRRRVAELEQALRQKEEEAREWERAALEQPRTETAGQEDREEGDAADNIRDFFRKQMERMKREEPERYAEMQERREAFRKQMEDRARDRREILSSVDPSLFTPRQKKNHEKLLAMMESMDALRERLRDPENRTEEDRRAIRETFMELGGRLRAERSALLSAAAQSAGLPRADADALAEQVRNIYTVTSLDGGRHHGPGPWSRWNARGEGRRPREKNRE